MFANYISDYAIATCIINLGAQYLRNKQMDKRVENWKKECKRLSDAREFSEQSPDTRVWGLENSSPIFPVSVKLQAFFYGSDPEKVGKSSSVVLNLEVSQRWHTESSLWQFSFPLINTWKL